MEVAKFLCKCGEAFMKFTKFKEHIYQHKDGTGDHKPVQFKASRVKDYKEQDD